ncbi:MAG: DUF1616 domain-containing protein [Candidatus Woesearchaeota archaeon]
MILQINQIIFGLLFSLFIPGFLVTLILFKELDLIEKIGLGMVLSICIDIALGLFLGYNEYMKNLTGGIIARNIWIGLVTISLIFFIVYLFQKRLEKVNDFFEIRQRFR